MPKDAFETTADSPTAPSSHCFAITPDDNADVQQITKAIYIGGGGDVSILPVRSSTPVIFRNVPAGAMLDVRVRKVFTTDTTAAHILGLA